MAELYIAITDEEDDYGSPYRVRLFKDDKSDEDDDLLSGQYEYIIQDPSWDREIPYDRYKVTSAVLYREIALPISPDKVDVKVFSTKMCKVAVSHRTTAGAAHDNPSTIHVFKTSEELDFIIGFCALFEYLNTLDFPSSGVMRALKKDFHDLRSWTTEFLNQCRNKMVEEPITVE